MKNLFPVGMGIMLAIACGAPEERQAHETHISSSATPAPFDARFIDAMTEHHLGAVTMAGEALDSAVHPEIISLATGIIAGQSAEIDSMGTWRAAWYPDLGATGGMGMSMGAMEIAGSREIPWDIRFLDAMISHHEGAIVMAEEALDSTVHPEILSLATGILAAQQEEIIEMRVLRAAWSEPVSR
jgi:uncharacterized protein (DUF305 family)